MTGLGAFGALAPAHLAAAITGFSDGNGPGLVHSAPFPHPGAVELALLTAGMLWTAIELPVSGERLAGRRLRTVIGYGALMAAGPVFAVGFAVGLFHVGSPPDRSLAVAALIGLSGISTIAMAEACGGFAHGIFRRKHVLVVGNSYDLLPMDARLAPGHLPEVVMAGILPLGDGSALGTKSLRRRRIWGIVATDEAMLANPELSTRCRRDRIRLVGATEFRERWLGRVDIDHFEPGALAANGSVESTLATRLARRSADIVLSLLLLICTLPLGALITAFIKFDSRGPVFSSEERVGLHGQLFRLIMFRSTRVNANAGLDSERGNVGVSELTRVGRLLRWARIDALPQLWNVLRGDMSVIGPRPEHPSFAARLATALPCYNDRTLVKPGITGWAQVNCGYGALVEHERMQLAYDLYYLKHRGVLLDLRILGTTIRTVLSRTGSR